MGTHLRTGNDAAAWLRGAGAGTFLGAPGALPTVMRRLQHTGVCACYAGPDVLPVAPADDPPLSKATGHFHAKKFAAPQRICISPGGVFREQVSTGQRRVGYRNQSAKGQARYSVQRQGIFRFDGGEKRASHQRLLAQQLDLK